MAQPDRRSPVEVGVLGPVQIRGGAGVVPLGSARQRALLVALVLRRGQLIPPDELCAAVWGQDPPPTAVGSLRSRLSRLRNVLTAAGAPSEVVLWRDAGYLLEAGEVGCDADRFEELTLRARTLVASGEARRGIPMLQHALELWRGPAFVEFADQPFAQGAAAQLEDLRLAATEDLCAALLESDEASAALARLDVHVVAHPFRERACELRMLALYRLGRQADALAGYRRARALLVKELGVEPCASLRELENRILRQDPDLGPFAAPRRADGVPAAPVGRTPFVGRAPECAKLDRLLDAAAAGRGALVMIGGEPGVGKTRLGEEFLARARSRGMSAYAGHSYEATGAAPFVALVEIMESALARAESPAAWRRFLGAQAAEIARLIPKLRTLCPDIPAPLELPPEQERRLLFNSLREVVERRARQNPLVLLFDDLHWADDATLLCLEHLAERVAEVPLLLVATYRDTEVDVGRPLAKRFEDLRRRRLAQWMELGRLDRADVAAMLVGLSGQSPPDQLTSAVHGRTEGNPFLVEEVYSYLLDSGRILDEQGCFRTDLSLGELEVPPGVRLVVGRRLRRLADGTLPVLNAAAVAGRAFSVELLEVVDGLEPQAILDAVEDAARARMIVGSPDASGEDRFIFAHELIRQTLLADLSLTRRRRLHARLADARERHYADAADLQAATIAHHLLEAGSGRSARAFAHLIRAGRFAMAAAAFEEAVAHYERAVAVADLVSPAERADLLFELGNATASLGRTDSAVEIWTTALDDYEALGDAVAVGRVCVAAGYNLGFMARWSEAVAMAERGLAVLGDRRVAERGRLLGLNAYLSAYVGRFQPAQVMVAEQLALAVALHDEPMRADGLFNEVAVRMAHMQHREMLSAGAAACELFRAAGDTWNLVKTVGCLGYAATGMGQWDLARSLAAEFLPIAEHLGHGNPISQLTRSVGVIEFATTGDVDRIERLGHEDRVLQENLGLPWPSCWSWLGLAHFLRGDWAGSLPLFREAARREPPGALCGFNAALLFEALAYCGQPAEALAVLDAQPLPDPAQVETMTWGACQRLVFAVDGLVVLGERDRAAALYPALAAVFDRTGVICPSFDDARLAERAAGIAAAAGEQWDLAERHFGTALRQADELPHRLEAAHTRRWYGRMLLERGGPGDRAAAERLLRTAIADYERMGILRHRQMCAELVGG